MAEKLPSQQEIKAARDKEAAAKKAWQSFEMSPNPTPAEFKQKDALEKVWNTAKKARETLEKPLRNIEKNLKKVEDAIKQAEQVAKNPASREAAQKELTRLRAEQKKLAGYVGTLLYEPEEVVPTTPTTPTTSAEVMPATGMTEEQKAAMRQRNVVGGGFGATAAKPAPKTGKGGKPAAPSTAGGPPTEPGTAVGDSTTKGGVNYIWNGTKWVAQGKVAFESIVEKFKTMFPSSAWIADIDPAKYPDVRGLLERAVTGRYADSEQGLARFKAEWESTDFFTELKTDNQVREIKSLVGDLGFDTVPFNKFLTTSMNMGWKGDTLKAEVYKEVFRRDDATDAFVNPTAVERVKKSNPYLALAKIGKQYFSSVDDRDIQGVLTGEMLTEDVQRKQRELAKTRYGHLANLIDQGFTLDELATPFKNQAAQLLEKTPDDIDMSQAQFEAAYNYGEPGQKRMMTQGEWEIMLRSDAKYGWDKTNNAKAEARQLASSIAQAFGRVI